MNNNPLNPEVGRAWSHLDAAGQEVKKLEAISEAVAKLTAPPSTAFLKRNTIKKYALAVSKARRAGKFKRVGDTFFIGVEAEFEGKVRQLASLADGDKLTPLDGITFVTGHAKAKAAERLEQMARAIIHGKVMRHPSVGVTLKD